MCHNKTTVKKFFTVSFTEAFFFLTIFTEALKSAFFGSLVSVGVLVITPIVKVIKYIYTLSP